MEQEEYQEFSLKHLIGKSKDVVSFLISKSIIIIPVCIIGGALGYIFAINQKPKYSANLTFVLSVESKSNGLGGLASQFGIDLGGSAGSDVFAGDNIITLFKSRKMIDRVLFKRDPIKNELLINLYVNEYMIEKDWRRHAYLKGTYPFHENIPLTPTQDSLVNEIYLKIIQENLSVNRNDRKLSVYEVNTLSENEIFSTYLTRYIVDETARFYIDTKTSISKLNLTMLQHEADSLRNLLGLKISTTASEIDRTFNLNPALQVQRSSIQKNQVNVNVLTTAYGEVIKNLEIAKINLQKETPLYQIIDIPSLPLKAIKVSKIIYTLVGFLIAFIILVSYLFIKKYLSDQNSAKSSDE